MVIALLCGTLETVTLKYAIVMCGQVGYKVQLPLRDLSRLGKPGDQLRLHIHTHVKEDTLDLFGFLDEDTLCLFENFISISGIGPKVALSLLSGMNVQDIHTAIHAGEHQSFTRIPGVGNKTAQRIVIELKDKIHKLNLPLFSPAPRNLALIEDLRSAISNLGYKKVSIEKALALVGPSAKAGKPIETLLKEALQHLS